LRARPAVGLYTDRGSHYFVTLKAGEAVDKSRPTQVGRALRRLGVEHIPAYSPEARGRSERMFGTLQERLPKELKLAGITDVEAANRFLTETYLPVHNARFSKPAAVGESAFVAADADQLVEILCIEEERIVARDNTVSFAKLRLQLPQSPWRHHFVKANVKVRQYPDGALAIFHGPRCIGRYDAMGQEIGAPIPSMLHPGSTPSRHGLEASRPPPSAARRPALTASRHGAGAP
jgi:hypothetical protein